MTSLDRALALAARGFHVFPLKRKSKLPSISEFPTLATRDPEQLAKWFTTERNIGISTSAFGDAGALVVVDVDTKLDKHGDQSMLQLELEGFEFPATLSQRTASGGMHLIYWAPVAHKQGTDVLGGGLDIRSRGGYIVAPGSSTKDGAYTQINGHEAVAPAPQWLLDRLGRDDRPRAEATPLPGIDASKAEGRALAYLGTQEGAPQGSRGSTAYKLAAKLKDFGCDEATAFNLLNLYWADKCAPPMPEQDLEASVQHAFKYGKEAQGSAAPEAIFSAPLPEDAEEPISKHPFEQLNSSFAFIKKGGFILQETTDDRGEFTTDHLSTVEFHAWHANVPFSIAGKKPMPISQWWMEWKGRRQFEGVVFYPEKDPGFRWYNLWRGFSVQPATSAKHPSVDAFLEHARVNVCGGDPALLHWLLGYFAHMIQRPWEKPLVALVFKGKKGTGKNALVERVGALLGPHFLVADDDRYLLSNFNAHLETNLFFVLDEAAWAGDKKAEGRLKGLITGTRHNIERKGHEPYRVSNLVRVAIIGNEDWLVPATHDERRYAVFNLGEKRIQDRKFFQDMREGMETGGYAHLLRYFLDFDLSGVDVNDAPKTEALIDQKHASLDLVEEWWLDCLHTGQIAGGDWAGEWPEAVATNRLRDALARWARSRSIRSRLPHEIGFGRILARIAPRFDKHTVRPEHHGDTTKAYFTPGLDKLREDWEQFIGGKIKWSS